MREYISGHIVANTIRMARAQFVGSFLIVEGDTDARLYKRFVDSDKCKVIPAHGKDNAIAALSTLDQDHFAGALAIVDADFAVLDGQLPSSQHLLLTDAHDHETMILKSPALEKILIEFGSEEKLTKFTNQTGKDIRKPLLESAVPVGYLRWVSLKDDLSLKFEELEFTKFINRENLNIDVSKLIITVKNKSQRPDLAENSLKERIRQLKNVSHDPWHICCGHDLIEILSIGFCKAIGSCNTNDVRQEVLERSLRLAFESAHFNQTQLYLSILNWEKANEPYLILNTDN